MKHSILVSLFITVLCSSLILPGCQNQDAQLTQPTDEEVTELVPMPDNPILGKIVTATTMVSADSGGVLGSFAVSSAEGSFTASSSVTSGIDFAAASRVSSPTVSLIASVYFAPGSAGSNFIATMSANTDNLVFDFGPEGTAFTTPATFSVWMKGINFSKMSIKSTSKIYLKYWNPTKGVWQRMPGTVTFDVKTGTLQCLNGQLPHFSRYGFGT
jgi:hypothetical protein